MLVSEKRGVGNKSCLRHIWMPEAAATLGRVHTSSAGDAGGGKARHPRDQWAHRPLRPPELSSHVPSCQGFGQSFGSCHTPHHRGSMEPVFLYRLANPPGVICGFPGLDRVLGWRRVLGGRGGRRSGAAPAFSW